MLTQKAGQGRQAFAAARLYRVASLVYEIYNYGSSGKFNNLLLNYKSVKSREPIAQERGDYAIYNYGSSGKLNNLHLNYESVKTRNTIARERGNQY